MIIYVLHAICYDLVVGFEGFHYSKPMITRFDCGLKRYVAYEGVYGVFDILHDEPSVLAS